MSMDPYDEDLRFRARALDLSMSMNPYDEDLRFRERALIMSMSMDPYDEDLRFRERALGLSMSMNPYDEDFRFRERALIMSMSMDIDNGDVRYRERALAIDDGDNDEETFFGEDLGFRERTLIMSMPMDSGNDDTLFEKVVDAIGGEEALRALVGLEMEATGETHVGFESELPEELARSSTYTRTYTFDLIDDNLRVDETLTPKFEAFQFFPAVTFSRVVNGKVGGLSDQVITMPQGTLPSASVAALKRQQMLFNPHLILKMALDDPSIVSTYAKNVLVIDDEAVTDIFLHIDPDTGLITKLKTMESNPLIRDTEIAIHYKNWNLESGGVLFPETVVLKNADNQKLWKEKRSFVEINEVEYITDPIFDLPNGTDPDSFDPDGYQFGLDSHHNQEGFFEVGFLFPSNPGIGPTMELASGIFLLPTAASSLAIQYASDKVIVLEAPSSEMHGKAIVDTVNELVPGGEITHLVQSHHHVDHASGCLQVIGSADPTFVVGHGIKDFWKSVLAADSDIRMDAISESMNGDMHEYAILQLDKNSKHVLVDQDNLVVTVYSTDLDPHAADAVVTTIETNGELFLFEADMYNAGFGLTVVVGGPQALFDFMRLNNIIDENCISNLPLTIIPTHGAVQTLEESIAELDSLGVDVGC